MVYYFVIGADGSRYGPADIDTLVQWARQGRIIDSTILIERGTERQLPAGSITAIAAELRRLNPQAQPVSIERQAPPISEATTLPPPADFQPPAPPGESGASQPPIPPVLSYGKPRQISPKSRVVAGLLGIFLGGLGIHRFYLGYTGMGLLMLLLTVFGGTASLACVPGAGCGIVALWGFIEGIICLAGGMRDANGLELRD